MSETEEQVEEIKNFINLIESCANIDKLTVPGFTGEQLERFEKSKEFKKYMLQHVYLWVIQSYLVNAKINGLISSEEFINFIIHIKPEENRETFVTSIIMSSVYGSEVYEKDNTFYEEIEKVIH